MTCKITYLGENTNAHSYIQRHTNGSEVCSVSETVLTLLFLYGRQYCINLVAELLFQKGKQAMNKRITKLGEGAGKRSRLCI